MITKDISLQLVVTRSRQLDTTTMAVYFERPPGFSYESGDWIDINFYDGNPSGGITYSLSSSPTEDYLAITFRLGVSPFKKRLQSLKTGDTMYISQYGNDYGFHLKENRFSVLIAGGIGIAPFRSMLKEMVDTQSTSKVQLIYQNKINSYIFADEISTWQTLLQSMDTHFIATAELNRKKRHKLLVDLIDTSAHHYFIAGPESMVESTEHLLIDDLGISPKDIRIDSFSGY